MYICFDYVCFNGSIMEIDKRKRSIMCGSMDAIELGLYLQSMMNRDVEGYTLLLDDSVSMYHLCVRQSGGKANVR
jgi:hypothetical protein